MAFKTGTIILFKYRRYKRDPQPLVLILYGGDRHTNIHGLNLHYLSNNLTDEMIDFVIKIVSHELSYRDMKKLYHDYMKHKLPGIIQRSYRTYKPKEIQGGSIISRGFHETVTFLQKLKRVTGNLTNPDLARIQSKIKAQINTEKKIEKELKKATPEQLAAAVQNYVKMLASVSQGFRKKAELKKYTK